MRNPDLNWLVFLPVFGGLQQTPLVSCTPAGCAGVRDDTSACSGPSWRVHRPKTRNPCRFKPSSLTLVQGLDERMVSWALRGVRSPGLPGWHGPIHLPFPGHELGAIVCPRIVRGIPYSNVACSRVRTPSYPVTLRCTFIHASHDKRDPLPLTSRVFGHESHAPAVIAKSGRGTGFACTHR